MRQGGKLKICFGFTQQRDEQGHVIGWSGLELARRSAYEVLGLRRPEISQHKRKRTRP